MVEAYLSAQLTQIDFFDLCLHLVFLVFAACNQKKNTNQRVEEYIPYAYQYNPLLIRKRSWILTIHKAKGHSTEMNFKKWVKSIQTAGYNGAHTVFEINTVENICCLTLHIALCILWGLYTVTLRLRAAAVMEAEDLSIYIDW